MKEMLKSWGQHLIKDRKAYIVGLVLLQLWSVLVWLLSQSHGDQRSFYFDWLDGLEWTIWYVSLLSCTFGVKQWYGESQFRSNPWLIAAAGMVGSIIAGIVIDLFFVWIGPLLDIHYDVTLVYYDIELPSWISHTVTFTFFGIFVALFFAQMQILRYKHHLEIRLSQSERENLKNLNELANLSALQARVNPHFLYNSLNSIAALIRSKSEDAEEMVIALSELFRYHILPEQSDFVTLAEELSIIETYLAIEKIRFGDQLMYAIEVDSSCKALKIPRLLVQPLVENAIKHGTSKMEKGHLKVSANQTAGRLNIEVFDNGPGFSDHPNTGTGLSNIHKMLDFHYQNDFQFELVTTPEKKVFLSIPAQS